MGTEARKLGVGVWECEGVGGYRDCGNRLRMGITLNPINL